MKARTGERPSTTDSLPRAAAVSSSNYPLYERYRTADAAFSGVTAYLGRTFRVGSPDGVEPVVGQFVSGNYHAVVGARIVVGRGFANEPDRDTSKAPVAVISDAYWARRFGRSPHDDRQHAECERQDRGSRRRHGARLSRPRLRITERPHATDIRDGARRPDFFDDHGGWIALRLACWDGASVISTVSMPQSVTVAVRTTGRPEAFSTAVRAEVRRLNPNAMVWYVRTMTEQLETATVRERLPSAQTTSEAAPRTSEHVQFDPFRLGTAPLVTVSAGPRSARA